MALNTKELSELISGVVLSIVPNVVYLRATDQEANIEADQLDLADRVFVLYNNKPTIDATLVELSGLITETYPIEISFLCLADFDDNDVDTDEILSPLVDYARKTFDQLAMLNVQPEYSDSYSIELGEDTTKIYDKVMSGVKLTFDWVLFRGITCADPAVRLPNPLQPQPDANAGVNPSQPAVPPLTPVDPNAGQPQPAANAGVNVNQPAVPPETSESPNAGQPQPAPNAGVNPSQTAVPPATPNDPNANQPQPADPIGVNPDQPAVPPLTPSIANPNQPQPIPTDPNPNPNQPQPNHAVMIIPKLTFRYIFDRADGGFTNKVNGSSVAWTYLGQILPAIGWENNNALTANSYNNILFKDITTEFPVLGRWTRIRVTGTVANESDPIRNIEGNLVVGMFDDTTNMTMDIIPKIQAKVPFAIESAWRVMTTNEIGISVHPRGNTNSAAIWMDIHTIDIDTVTQTPTPPPAQAGINYLFVLGHLGFSSYGAGLPFVLEFGSFTAEMNNTIGGETAELGRLMEWSRPQMVTPRVQGQSVGVEILADQLAVDFLIAGEVVQTINIPATTVGQAWTVQFLEETVLYSHPVFYSCKIRQITAYDADIAVNQFQFFQTYLP